MNVPIEFIFGLVSVILAIGGYFFRSHDARITDNASDITEMRLVIAEQKQALDESRRIRASDMITLHQVSKQIQQLMEKIHDLSLQLKDKQDR